MEITQTVKAGSSTTTYKLRGKPADVELAANAIFKDYPQGGYGTRLMKHTTLPAGEVEVEIFRANSCD